MRPLDPRLLRYARSARAYLVVTVLLGALTGGLLVAQAWLLARAVTGVFRDGETVADLAGLVAALVAVSLARGLVVAGQDGAAHRSATAVKEQLRARLLRQVVALGPAWTSGQRSGEIATLATKGLDALDGYFARYLPQLVLVVVVPATVVAVLLGADLTTVLIVVLTIPLIPVFMVLIGKTTETRTQRQWRSLEILAGHFLDVVEGLPTLKVFNRAKAQAATIRQVSDEYRRTTMSVLRVSFLSSLVLELIATLSVALVAVSVGLRLVDGSMTLQVGLFVLVLVPEAYLPLRLVGQYFHAAADGLAAAERVFQLLETPVPGQGTCVAAPDLRGATVRLADATVSYEGRDGPALSHATLEVRPGEVLVLVGPSGAGKSTLLGVLLGFVPLSGGRVSVTDASGETELGDVDLAQWRRQIAWVPQRPQLVAATIAENVRLADPAADDGAVMAALEQAGAAEFVRRLPDGIHTHLGDRGAGLSGGQRQRVALARAFLRDAPLVLLDEPTASLDGATEREVLAAVRRLAAGRTVVLVAHRPALLELADRVVRVEPAGREAVPA